MSFYLNVTALLLFSGSLMAQPAMPYIKERDPVLVSLENAHSSGHSMPFGGLIINDSRFDSSCLGFFVDINHTDKIYGKKYIFNRGIKYELGKWYSQYLGISEANGKKDVLFINIKKLRISSQAITKKTTLGDAGEPENGWEKGIIAKIEYFLLNNDEAIPLYRYDSIMVVNGNFKEKSAEFISNILALSLEKLMTIDIKNLAYTKKIRITDIFESNKKYVSANVLNDTVFKKGIFRDFEEFKSNSPSIFDFELKTTQLSDALFIKEDGAEFPCRNLWGYSDGKDIYIHSGNKFFKLIRSGNTFIFLGIKSLTRLTSVNLGRSTLNSIGSSFLDLPSGRDIQQTSYKKKQLLLEVDMETGQVY